MNELKATPGPWEYSYLDANEQAVVKGEYIEVATCWHHCVGSIEKEMHANAYLIATAPTLYRTLEATAEKLQLVMQANDYSDEAIDAALKDARAALKKANGADS